MPHANKSVLLTEPRATAHPATEDLREWLQRGPFALAMSSGYFGFFAHAGALRTLLEHELVPAKVCGSSAGGLVAIAYAAGVSPEELLAEFVALKRADFWDPGLGFGLLKGDLFEARLQKILPVTHFENTRIPCSVSVFDMLTRRTVVMRTGALATAARATCALPGLFHPVRHRGRFLWDGGILDRPGLDSLPKEERVLYLHLDSRSPQRNHAKHMPQRENLRTIRLSDLPRLGPLHLEDGATAAKLAGQRVTEALDSSART